MITERSVQNIIENAHIEDVVNDYVNLKKRGANLIGLCPFHNEKTPSFSVSPAKGIYKCFGCGKGGNSVQFVMEHEGFSFPEALKHLAAKFNIEVEETETSDEHKKQKQHLDSLYLVNQFAESYFQKNLLETDEGKSVGLSYFKSRSYLEDTIKKFGLGYSSSEPAGLTTAAKEAGYNIDLLKQVRLTNNYDKDFFRERVMFTIHNLSGKPIAFAGRTLKTDKKSPKYVNSPETELYIKSKILYGIYHAKKAIRNLDECILVEGYTDVISLSQAGVENVVASSGTALTEQQIRLVKRFTNNIKLLYDGDAAGIKAASRGLDLALSQDLNVSVVPLPEGEDPDSLVQKLGSTEFSAFLAEKSEDFILFKTNRLIEDSKNDPIRKSKSITEIVNSIAKIPDPIKRSVYIKECSRLLEIDEAVLMETANKALKNNLSQQWADQKREAARREREENQPPTNPADMPPEMGNVDASVPASPAKTEQKGYYKERDIIKLLLNYGDQIISDEEYEGVSLAQLMIIHLEDVLDHFQNPTYKLMIEMARDKVNAEEQVNAKYFIHHRDKEIRTMAVTLCSEEFEYSDNWWEMHQIDLRTQPKPEENFFTEGMQALKYFKLTKIKSMMAENAAKMKKENADVILLVKTHQRLLDMRNELAKELRIVLTH